MPALLSPPGVGKARPGLGRQGLDEPPRAGWGEAGSAPIWREAVARKPGVEGTFWCHVLQAPFPPSQPHPAGRVACRGDGTSAPGGQKEKGGRRSKEKTVLKSVSSGDPHLNPPARETEQLARGLSSGGTLHPLPLLTGTDLGDPLTNSSPLPLVPAPPPTPCPLFHGSRRTRLPSLPHTVVPPYLLTARPSTARLSWRRRQLNI